MRPIRPTVAGCLGGLALGLSLSGMAAAQDVTLRWALHPGSEADAVINYFAPRYEEETGVRVIGEILPPDQLRDRMAIEAIGGTGRWDIGYHSPGWFGTFVDHVIDLGPLMEEHGFDIGLYPDQVIESHMRSGARPGEIIALPTSPAAPMLIARRDFLEHPDEQAAFEERFGYPLAMPETFAQLRDVAEFFTRPAGAEVAGQTLDRPLYGWADALGSGAGITRSFIVFLYSTGVSGWDDDFTPDIDHPIVAEVADFFVEMATGFAPREAQSWNFLEGLSMFNDGYLATATMWPQGLDAVENPAGPAAGNVAYAPLPMWEGNLAGLTQGKPFLGGGGVFVFDTPNAEEAFRFLNWMLNENEIEWARQSGQFVTRNHFTDPELAAAQPHFADFLPAYGQVLEEVFVRQTIPEYGAVMWNGTTDFITDVFSGDLTAEQAQARWVQTMEAAFRRAGYIE